MCSLGNQQQSWSYGRFCHQQRRWCRLSTGPWCVDNGVNGGLLPDGVDGGEFAVVVL